MSYRRGFTLVELLVVVAIISVLAALLLPALHKAITEARFVACTSQQRGLYLANSMYWQDYDDYLVAPSAGNVPASWVYYPAGAYSKPWDGPVNLGALYKLHYLDDPNVVYCPAHEANGTLKPGGQTALTQIYDTGTTSTAASATYIVNASNAGGEGWYEWRKYSRIYDWHLFTRKLEGNLPGAELYHSIWPPTSLATRRFLKTPRFLLYCALPRGWHGPWNRADLGVHGQYGFNILWFDGTLSRVRTTPGDPQFYTPSGHWYYRDTLLNSQYPDFIAP